MKKQFLRQVSSFVLLLGLFAPVPIMAQVTIGSSYRPLQGALLDLKEKESINGEENSIKGLMLPRVELKTLTPATGKLSESINGTGIWAEDMHTGLLVYNVNQTPNACTNGALPGVYTWNGRVWESLIITKTPQLKNEVVNTNDYPGANCYITTINSTITIPIARAYKIWSDYSGTSANTGKVLSNPPSNVGLQYQIVWETASDGTTNGVLSTTASFSGSGNNQTLTIVTGNKTGNALVRVSDNTGKVVWQWHIWVTEDSFLNKPVYYNNGSASYWYMDRLLGANTQLGSGLYYQWGRPTPFVDNGDIATIDGDTSASVNLLNAIQTSQFIIYNDIASHDWYSPKSSQWNERWGDQSTSNTTKKSAFDPCPEGWRVPSFRATQATSSEPIASPWACLSIPKGTFDNGWTFNTTSYQLGFYRANGYRSNGDGSIGDIDIAGYEWTATPANSMAYFLKFSSTNIDPAKEYNRANGLGVRCVKDIK